MNEKMVKLGTKRSVIRELFEYGLKRKKEIGENKVFDFSIGNPSIPAPECVTLTMERLLKEVEPTALHGYTPAPGAPAVREKIAEYIRKEFGAQCRAENIYMTCGAAAALTSVITAVTENRGDEIITFTPFFPEYKVFIEHAGAKLVTIDCAAPGFELPTNKLLEAITEKTRAVIINSPNNPTGRVIPESEIVALAKILTEKSAEYGKPIYLIADEPYRELVYGGVKVPFVPNYYDNTIVCYSFSKSMSLPGERIGYAFVSPKCEKPDLVFTAVAGAARALGFVCAPSILQFTVAENYGKTADIAAYEKNRELLYDFLVKTGYTVVKPDGAFYLFVKALEEDAGAFSEKAKRHELLLVPSDDFGCPGYVRIAYCTAYDTIVNSLAAFKALFDEYARLTPPQV